MDNNAPRNTWAQTTPEGVSHRLTVPSGNQVDAVRLGMEGLVRAGVLAEGDALTALVDRKHIRRVRGGKGPDRDEIDAASLLEDPEQFGKIIMVMDRMIPHICLSPTVMLHFEDVVSKLGEKSTRKIPVEERKLGQAYTDQIPMEDKMFLFNWSVGGSADAETFLRESTNAMAAVEDGAGVPNSAKRPSRGKKHKRRLLD